MTAVLSRTKEICVDGGRSVFKWNALACSDCPLIHVGMQSSNICVGSSHMHTFFRTVEVYSSIGGNLPGFIPTDPESKMKMLGFVQRVGSRRLILLKSSLIVENSIQEWF